MDYIIIHEKAEIHAKTNVTLGVRGKWGCRV